jgi:DNA primase
MNLFDLVEEMGLEPQKTSSSRGGEFHCPCLVCGGDDRFMFWPETNRYWCRQCKAKGDAIQFCRDFQKLSFHEACVKTKKDLPESRYPSRRRLSDPAPVRIPSSSWQDRAKIFTESSLRRLLIDKTAMELLLQRGLTVDTIKKHRLGWNPVKAFYRRTDWGFEEKDKQEWVCLPVGMVIPISENDAIRKIKIRKSEWREGDPYGKYYEIPGSSNILPVFGSLSNHVVVIVEAEFDAMLVIQEAGNLCSCVALGGAQKRPDAYLQQWLLQRKLILFALDFDEAGKNEYSYWQTSYPNLEPWPTPEEKSPGEYFKIGGNLKDWISNGIKNVLRDESSVDSLLIT